MLFKTFGTKENFKRLNEQVEKSGIVEMEEKAVGDSVKAVGNAIKTEEKTVVEEQPKPQKPTNAKEEEKPVKKDKKDFTQYMQN